MLNMQHRPAVMMQERTLKEHKKSRLGCLVCKTRKIKCDERHPICGNCKKRFPDRTSCYYPPPDAIRAKPRFRRIEGSIEPFEASSGQAELSSITQQLQPSGRRALESRLWDHYLTKTAHTMPPPHRKDLRTVWTEEIPGWSASHPCLLDALLGLTAIHIYVEGPDPDKAMLQSAYEFYANAASGCRKALVAGVNLSNAAPILATAMIIGFQSKTVPRLHAEQNDEPYTLPLDIFKLQRGTMTTYNVTAPFLLNDRLRDIIFATMPPEGGIPSCDDPADLTPEVFQDAQSILFEIDASSDMLPESKDACRSALAHVLNIYRWLENESVPEMMFRRCVPAFFWLVPESFIELLEGKPPNPFAMLVLARYFAVSRACGDMTWWARGMAEREINGIARIMPDKWLEFMALAEELVMETEAVDTNNRVDI